MRLPLSFPRSGSLAARIVLLNALLTLPGFAADQTVANPPPSAGLINDWLRGKFPAANAWDVGGQFRARYESRDNAGFLPSNDFLVGLKNSDDYYQFRTKAHVGWTPTSWVAVFGEGRDAHTVGDSQSFSVDDLFDLHQAYVRFGDVRQFPLVLKAGRQELSYGDQRYVGVSDWSNLGRTFDAVKLRFENEHLWVDAFSGRQVLPWDGHFNESNDYDLFSGLYASTGKLLPWQETQLYFLARNVQPGSLTAISETIGGPGPRDIYTIGTRWKSAPGELGNWDYLFEAAGQFGNITQGGGVLNHRGFAVDATGGYTLKDTSGQPRFTVGYDYGSGDHDPNDGTDETFQMLLGTNHRFYGLMDIFGLRNMHIPRAGVSISPLTNVSFSVEWLGFWLAQTTDFLYPESGPGRSRNGYGRNPGFNSQVGNEIDLLLSWQPAKWGQLQTGYGHFFAGDYIRESAAAGGFDWENAGWFYAQATFNF